MISENYAVEVSLPPARLEAVKRLEVLSCLRTEYFSSQEISMGWTESVEKLLRADYS